MEKQAPAHKIELRVARTEKEVEVKTLAKRLNVRLKKSREGDHPRPDVTRGSIEYFLLKPKAKAMPYLQPGETVSVKVDAEWVHFKLLGGKRLS